jgi:hypothetical protein
MGPEISTAVAPQLRQAEGNNFVVIFGEIAQVMPTVRP